MIAPARWADLRRFTPARVAREGAGNGLPTAAHLAFQAAHAAARDAVHAVLDVAALRSELKALGIARVTVRSLAPDRHQYLLRSDLGRQLRPEDRVRLIPISDCFAFVMCGGLSAIAIRRHAATLLAAVGPARRARAGARGHRRTGSRGTRR